MKTLPPTNPPDVTEAECRTVELSSIEAATGGKLMTPLHTQYLNGWRLLPGKSPIDGIG